MGAALQGRCISLVKVMEDGFQMFKCLLWQESENTGTCTGNKGREEPDVRGIKPGDKQSRTWKMEPYGEGRANTTVRLLWQH